MGAGVQVVHCVVPLRDVLHYSRTLSSMTGGQGSYSIEFGEYEIMPPSVQHHYLRSTGTQAEEEAALSS